MSLLKSTFLAAAFAVVAVFNPAFAIEPYTKDAFKAAQAAGEHIVLEFTKPGCPTCAAQKPTLDKAKAQFPNATFFKVNYVTDKQTVRTFNVPRQSTIVVFNGTEETGRLVAETRETPLLELIASGA